MPLHRFAVPALAFIEGASVLGLEIVAGQLLAPAFGDSVFKWLWVLITTMVGLTVGYSAAARFNRRTVRVSIPALLLLGGLCYEAAIPLWFDRVLEGLIAIPGHLPIAAASACVVLVPMVLFGMVPGLLVALNAEAEPQLAPRAGAVFAASTVGGLVAGLITGVGLIPLLGVTLAVRSSTGVLIVLLTIVQWRAGVRRAALVATGVWCAFFFWPQGDRQTGHRQKLLDYEEGILGQIAVVERPVSQAATQRTLYVNRMAQSVYTQGVHGSRNAVFSYVKDSLPVLASYPKRADALLLGLGGATVVRMMRELEFNVTAVELDRRIIEVAQRYFDAPRDVNYVLDDARRFIRRSESSFDIIFYDAYRGEYPPTHLITVESLRELQHALRPKGVVLINVAGRVDAPDSETVRSMVKTFRAAGMRCRVVRGQPSENALLIADRGEREYGVSAGADSAEVPGGDMRLVFFDDSALSYEKAHIFTDDRPILEALYRADAQKFRSRINSAYSDPRNRDTVPLYR